MEWLGQFLYVLFTELEETYEVKPGSITELEITSALPRGEWWVHVQPEQSWFVHVYCLAGDWHVVRYDYYPLDEPVTWM